MKKLIVLLTLSVLSTSAFSVTVTCTGVIDRITVNSNATVSLDLNVPFDGVTVNAGASQQVLDIAKYSLHNNAPVTISSFSDSNDTRCRDNNESLSFNSIMLAD